MAEDFTTFLMNTKMEDLNNPFINNWTNEGIISNVKNTIIQQVDEFYYKERYICNATNDTCIGTYRDYNYNIIQNLTDSLISSKYGFAYIIEDSALGINETIYNRSVDKRASSNLVVVSKKITFLQINATTIFGPQMVSITVWI